MTAKEERYPVTPCCNQWTDAWSNHTMCFSTQTGPVARRRRAEWTLTGMPKHNEERNECSMVSVITRVSGTSLSHSAINRFYRLIKFGDLVRRAMNGATTTLSFFPPCFVSTGLTLSPLCAGGHQWGFQIAKRVSDPDNQQKNGTPQGQIFP